MKVDLHGLPLSEAKLRAQISVAQAWESSKNFIEIVHGHNLGTVIKDYIQRMEGLQSDVKRIYPEISSLKLSDKGLGSTIIKFRRK
ncbi:MAG: hypothetical protein BEU00_01865 [Marine Group III euryarchaeote CG-Epi3]|jgi:DNA-nicking Smr family endonuclease|uniref:Smr domain-containing protein n=1 Tax=Marine Group III euryarchaeote CG-Epi3 TaxID=1888997 RepID=A0A1J5TP99_9ARCH|nr:MAG: hypothetical protein BEU00_01865 [Marine Group III euryarchaeote CG-Epi3]|tara:strand:+ start:1408 stop:1665 length:258 start_codon:yes stop_codon:yes gene_type:complete